MQGRPSLRSEEGGRCRGHALDLTTNKRVGQPGRHTGKLNENRHTDHSGDSATATTTTGTTAPATALSHSQQVSSQDQSTAAASASSARATNDKHVPDRQ